MQGKIKKLKNCSSSSNYEILLNSFYLIFYIKSDHQVQTCRMLAFKFQSIKFLKNHFFSYLFIFLDRNFLAIFNQLF